MQNSNCLLGLVSHLFYPRTAMHVFHLTLLLIDSTMLIANRASLWTHPTRTVHLVNNVIPSHIEFEWRQEKVPSVWAPPAHPVDTFLRLLIASAWVLWWWCSKGGWGVQLKSAGIVGGQHTTQGWCGNMGKTNTEAWAAQWLGREKSRQNECDKIIVKPPSLQ